MEVSLEEFKGCGGVGMANMGWDAGLGKGYVAGLNFHLSARVYRVITDSYHGAKLSLFYKASMGTFALVSNVGLLALLWSVSPFGGVLPLE
ncbi:hypothetical protein ACLB2K_050788 [Fragaria x ananassa]